MIKPNMLMMYTWMLKGFPQKLFVNNATLLSLCLLARYSTGKSDKLEDWKEYLGERQDAIQNRFEDYLEEAKDYEEIINL